jgi:hypothetical protein
MVEISVSKYMMVGIVPSESIRLVPRFGFELADSSAGCHPARYSAISEAILLPRLDALHFLPKPDGFGKVGNVNASRLD